MILRRFQAVERFAEAQMSNDVKCDEAEPLNNIYTRHPIVGRCSFLEQACNEELHIRLNQRLLFSESFLRESGHQQSSESSMISIIRGEDRAYPIRRRSMPDRIFRKVRVPQAVPVNIIPGAGFDEGNFVRAQPNDGAVMIVKLSHNMG